MEKIVNELRKELKNVRSEINSLKSEIEMLKSENAKLEEHNLVLKNSLCDESDDSGLIMGKVIRTSSGAYLFI